MKDDKLSHLDDMGRARMVDVGSKPVTRRSAVATARVRVSSRLLTMLIDNTLKKGDAFAAARIAGIQAAKRTSELIPLCHPLPLTHVSIDLTTGDDPPCVYITSKAVANYHTGVEMEALTAVSVAALTVYDMGKSIDRGITIESLRLESKSGGSSGDWTRDDTDG